MLSEIFFIEVDSQDLRIVKLQIKKVEVYNDFDCLKLIKTSWSLSFLYCIRLL